MDLILVILNKALLIIDVFDVTEMITGPLLPGSWKAIVISFPVFIFVYIVGFGFLYFSIIDPIVNHYDSIIAKELNRKIAEKK